MMLSPTAVSITSPTMKAEPMPATKSPPVKKPTATRKRKTVSVAKPADVPAICAELQVLQRQRVVIIKSVNMQMNRLQAVVAGTLGYSSGMDEKDRKAKFVEAGKLIRGMIDGNADSPLKAIVLATMVGIDALNDERHKLEKAQLAQVVRLPVAAWVALPEQRGFGLQNLAVVIGETGDLSNYANPAKVWRRMGCAPHSFDGKTLMGSSWRFGKDGKLPAAEWESFGYSPRRRSVAYNVGEPLLKLNGTIKSRVGEFSFATDAADASHAACEKDAVGADEIAAETETAKVGPYRARYDSAKLTFAARHPDYKPGRCHAHAMLLMTKLLLRNLWIEWQSK